MHKLLRITTISLSLDKLLKGQLKYLSQYYDVVGVASDIGSLDHVAQREGVRVVDLPMKREISVVSDLFSLIKMIQLIKKENPYIVHSNTPKASLLAMISAKICKVPLRIHTVTGLRFETTQGFLKRLLILMEKITCACATNVFPEGNGVRETLSKYKITKKPLKTILNGNINGIDTSFFDPAHYHSEELKNLRNKLNLNHNDFVFIFIGRLVKDKGINELVSTFKQLSLSVGSQISNPLVMDGYKTSSRSDSIDPERKNVKPRRGDPALRDIKLLLVGPLEEKLDPLHTETMREIIDNKNIISVGYQDDVRPYLAISDAFVFPSYREGFPNVVMQAGAMGLPSIVTDISGSNEIIIEGQNGIIIPTKNEDALSKAMRYFLENPEKVKQMAQNSRALIETRYEQKKVWKALLIEYKRLENEYV